MLLLLCSPLLTCCGYTGPPMTPAGGHSGGGSAPRVRELGVACGTSAGSEADADNCLSRARWSHTANLGAPRTTCLHAACDARRMAVRDKPPPFPCGASPSALRRGRQSACPSQGARDTSVRRTVTACETRGRDAAPVSQCPMCHLAPHSSPSLANSPRHTPRPLRGRAFYSGHPRP